MSPALCRACGSALPAGAQWCSLCFAEVPRRSVAARQPTLVGSGGPPVESGVPAQPGAVAVESWPCRACGTAVPLPNLRCDTCGAGFLDGAAAGPVARLPLVGEVSGMSAGQRAVVAVVAALVVTALLVVVAAAVGSLLR